MREVALVAAVFLALIAVGPTQAEDLEDALTATLKGAWVLTRIETYSDCGGFYTDTEVHGTRVVGDAKRRFAAGELSRVEKLNLKSDRLDLYLIHGEKVLEPRRDGPFTLLDERTCKVQLMVDLPRETVRAGDPGPVHVLLEDVVEIVGSHEAGRRHPDWNGRLREAYPPDYEATVQRHAEWQAEQENARVATAREAAIEEAGRIADRVLDEPDYLRGFAGGVEAQRAWTAPSCSALTSTSFYSVERKAPAAPRGVNDTRAFERGFKDGQALLFHLETARRLKDCFVPPPPVSR